ncbi:MAG: DUF2807 domain-containing protein [Saprospiraceae bacterium]
MKIILPFLLVCWTLSIVAQEKIPTFQAIEIDGPAEVELVAASECHVAILRANDLVTWETNGNSLVLIAQYKENQPVAHIRISIAALRRLSLTGNVSLTGQGVFANRLMDITIEGTSTAQMEIDTEMLKVEVGQRSSLTLSGKADKAHLKAKNNASLDAGYLLVHTGTVSCDANSTATYLPVEGQTTKQISNQQIILEEKKKDVWWLSK